MTQIIALAEPEGVILVADRLLTYPNGSVHDDDATKMILFEGGLLLAYTGLAQIGHRDTGEWLAMALADFRLASEALPGLTARLNERWRSIRAKDDRLTIIGAGAAHFDGEPRTYHTTVSNHELGQPGTGEFRWRVDPVPTDRQVVRVGGQPLPGDGLKRLMRNLRRVNSRNAGPQARGRLLAAAVRETATLNRRVGGNLLMALSAAEVMWARKSLVMSGGALSQVHVSVFLPADNSTARWKTMWIVSGGGVLIGGGGSSDGGSIFRPEKDR